MNVPLQSAGNFKRNVTNAKLGLPLMRFDLRYGDGSLRLELPDRLEVDHLEPTTTDDGIDLERSIIQSLENPIDSKPLSQIIAEAKSFAIVVNSQCDLELNSILLLELLEHFRSSTSNPTNVSVIFPVKHEASPVVREPQKLADDYQLIIHNPYSEEDLCLDLQKTAIC